MAQNLLELFVSVALKGEKTTIAGLKALEVQGQKTEDKLNNIASGMAGEAKKAEASSGRIQKTLGALERKAEKVNNQAVSLKMDLKGAGEVTMGLEAIKNRRDSLDRGKITLSTTLKGASEVIGELGTLEGVTSRIDGDKVLLTADVDGTEQSKAGLLSLQSVASRVDGDNLRMKVDVDGAPQAIGELAAISSVADKVDGRNVNLQTGSGVSALEALGSAIDGVATRMRSLQQVGAAAVIPGFVAAIGAIPAIVTPALSAVYALGGAIGAGLAGAATVGAGAAVTLGGAIGLIAAPVTMLLSKLGKYDESLDKVASKEKTAATAAKSYGDAQAQVQKAVANRGQVEADVASSVGDAWKKYERQQEETSKTAIDVQQANEDAAQDLQDSRTELAGATGAVTREQREYNEALDDEPRNQAYAELDLADARDRASDALDDYNEAVAEHGRNSEEATDAARGLERAELDLGRQQEETTDIQKNGSRELRDSFGELVHAQTDRGQAALDVSRAEQNADRVAAEGSQRMREARQAEADQFEAYRRAQTDGSHRIAAAQSQVEDAQRAAAQAAAALAEAEKGVLDEIVPLTAAQKRLYDEFQRFKGIGGTTFTPSIDQAARLGVQLLRLGGDYMPRLGKASFATMQALTGVFGTFRAELSKPVEQASFNRFLRTIPSFTEVAGNAFAKFSLAMLNFFARTLPYVMRFVGALDRGAQSFLNFTRSASGMAAIDRFLAYTTRKSVELWTATKNLAVGFFGLYSAMDQAGMVNQVWGGFLRLTRQFRDLTARGTESRGMVVDFFTASKPVLTALWSLVGSLVNQWFRVANAVMTMRNEAGKLVLPQALKDMRAALPIIGDMLIAAFRNFAPYIGPIIQGIAEFLKYFIALNPVTIALTRGVARLLQAFSGLGHGTKLAIAGFISARLAFAIISKTLVALFSPLGKVAVGLGLMAGKAGKAGVAARILGVALRFMMGPVGIVITAVAALAAGFLYLYRNNNTFKRAVDQTAAALKSRVMPVIRQVAQFFRQLLAPAIQFAQRQMQFVAKWWSQNLPLMGRTAKTVFNLIKLAVTTNLKIIFAVIKAVVGGIVRYWQANWAEIKSILVAVWEIIKSVVRTAIRNVLNLLKLGMQLITGDWRGAWRTVKTILSNSWENIKTIVRNALKILGNIIKLTWNSIKDLTLAAWNVIRDYIGDKIENAKERAVLTLKVMGQAMFDRYEAMKRSVKAAFEAIKGFMVDPIESAYNGIKDWVGKILGVVNTVLKAVGLDEIKLDQSGESTGGNGSSGRGSRPAMATFRRGGMATERFHRGGVGTSTPQPKTHMWNEQMGNEAFIAEREPSRTQMPYLKAAAGWHGMDVVPRRSSVPSHRGGPDGTEENARVHRHARGGISGLVRAFAYGGFGKEYYNSAASALDQAVMSRFPVDGSSYSGHPAGAVDFLVSSGQAQGQEKTLGDSVAGWLDSNYNALNLRALIWYARARYEGGAWQPYVDNYGGGSGDVASQMHYNHPHAESLSGSFGKLNEDQTKGFTGGGGGGGVGGAIQNLILDKFNKLWDSTVQPVADRFLKPLKDSDYVMANAAGAAGQKIPDGIKEWAINKLGLSGGGSGGSTQDPGQGGSNREIGERMLGASGVPGSFDSLNSLWTKESGWDEKAQNPTSTAFGIPQFLSCMPLDTDILTEAGWKTHDEVEIGDKTLGYNPKTGRSEWTRITDVFTYDEPQELVEFGNNRWKVRATPNHRWYVEKGRPSSGSQNGGFVETQEINTNHNLVLSANASTQKNPGITPDEAEIVGWILTEGSRNDVRGLSISIYQSKLEHVERLKGLLEDVPHSLYVRDRNPGKHLEANQFYLHAAYARDLIERSRLDELGPEGFVLSLGREQRGRFFRAVVDAEGWQTSSGTSGSITRITQNEGEVHDAIMLAAFLEGYRPKSRKLKKRKEHHSKCRDITLSRPKIHGSSLILTPVEAEPVWCVRTELGTWTTRQDEQVMLTGNSTWQQYGGKSTDPPGQIGKGLKYIADRYGGTDAAWQHSQANNWYSEGGLTNGPQNAVIGEAGPELVLPLSSARVMQSAQTALGVSQLHEEVRGMREDMKNLRVNVGDIEAPAADKLIVAQEHTTKRVMNGRDGLSATKKHVSSVKKVLDLSGLN